MATKHSVIDKLGGHLVSVLQKESKEDQKDSMMEAAQSMEDAGLIQDKSQVRIDNPINLVTDLVMNNDLLPDWMNAKGVSAMVRPTSLSNFLALIKV